MPRVGLEPTIQVFERAKMIHALDRAVNVIGLTETLRPNRMISRAECGPRTASRTSVH
jgi:hypothetical protein